MRDPRHGTIPRVPARVPVMAPEPQDPTPKPEDEPVVDWDTFNAAGRALVGAPAEPAD